jgi:hypothetical protein
MPKVVGHKLFFALLLLLVARIGHAQDPDESRQAQPLNATEYAQQLRLAEVYEETRDIQNASRIYGQLYKVNPSDPMVFEGLTRTLVYLKRYDDAEKIVNERLHHDQSLEVLLLSARVEARMNKRSEALDAFQKAEQAVGAKDCSQLFPVVYAMMDVSYNQDALDLLDRMRKLAGDDADICSSQIAGLYLRLGEFDRASKEFIALLKSGEGNVSMVEQRLAQYMTDSLSRSTVLSALEAEIVGAPPTSANLRLLSWLYGEKRDYRKALQTMIKLDNMADKSARGNQGYELLQFADRARSEGALDVAVEAYTEAIARLKSSDAVRQGYPIAQAELGSIRTFESFVLGGAHTKDSIASVVTKYEAFAKDANAGEFAVEALVRAGRLAFRELFDLDRATKDLETALKLSRSLSDNTREAAFGLVDIAFARANFSLASTRLDAIEKLVRERHSPAEREIRNRLQFDRALGEYYQMNFDTAVALLQPVAEDVSSDYANDAIDLSALISENSKPMRLPALKRYSSAALAEAQHNYDLAFAGYRAVVDSEMAAPLADDASLRAAEMQVRLGHALDATRALEEMQEKMASSPLLDQAAFREAEIVERELHDPARAQKLYEDFLARYPNSNFVSEARQRARKLRGDAF